MGENGIINGLYYEIKGSGEPIIFLHGIGGSHKMFKPQVEVLSNYYKTITVDLKGNGNSESVPTRKYLEVHCESLLDLMNYLNIQRATFVGLSYGGIVTQFFAIKHRKKVRKMVLMDTYAQMFPKNWGQIKLTMLGAFMTMAVWLPKKIVGRIFSPYKKWELAHQELLFNIEHWRAKDIMIQLIEVFGKDFLKEINKLDIPSLVIVGDAIDPVIGKSQEIAHYLPNSELMVVKDSVDPTNLCQPLIVNKALLNFIDE